MSAISCLLTAFSQQHRAELSNPAVLPKVPVEEFRAGCISNYEVWVHRLVSKWVRLNPKKADRPEITLSLQDSAALTDEKRTLFNDKPLAVPLAQALQRIATQDSSAAQRIISLATANSAKLDSLGFVPVWGKNLRYR